MKRNQPEGVGKVVDALAAFARIVDTHVPGQEVEVRPVPETDTEIELRARQLQERIERQRQAELEDELGMEP